MRASEIVVDPAEGVDDSALHRVLLELCFIQLKAESGAVGQQQIPVFPDEALL